MINAQAKHRINGHARKNKKGERDMRRNKKILSLLVAGCMGVALLTGCGGSAGSSTGANAESTESGESAAPVAASDAQSSDTGLGDGYLRDKVVMSASSDGGTFDPYSHSSFTASNLIFQCLLRQDTDGNIRYELAKSVEQVDDLHWTITLWDNIHDSEGNPLTASDVVFSIDKLIETGNESQVSKLDHLEIVDDYTLTWVCNEPFGTGDMEKQLSDPKIVTQAAYESHDFTNDPIGTGSYVLTQYVPGSTVVIEADEDFWMKDLPDDVKADLWVYDVQNVREIEFSIIADASTRAIALETGDIDIADSLDGSDAQAFASNDAISVVDVPVDPPAAFIFNCSEQSPLQDLNLRQAVCYALDNQAIIDGLTCPANMVYGISPRMYDAPEEWSTGREYYDYDIEKAKELVEASGYNGEEITLMYSSSVAFDALALMMQSQLGAIGINVNLYCVENSVIHTAMFDDTQWDIRLDTLGGGNYIGKIVYKFTSMDSENNLHGRNIMMIEDEKLDELSEAVYLEKTDENIAEWDEYFTYEKCYAYAVFGYSEQTACRSDVIPAFGIRYAIMPNACTFTD
jgi:ABC-type transport system substrate-binding protein